MNQSGKILVLALACGLGGVVAALPQSAPTLRGPGAAQQQRPSPTPVPSATAPPAPPSVDPRAQIRTTVSLVVVPVTVKSRDGELVTGLEARQFRVFEDGIEQEIASFSADPFPLSAAVLLDDDLKRSSADRVQETLQAVAGGFSAGDALEASDEVALWRFDDVPESISDFIGSSDTLLDQLKRIELNSSVAGAGSAPMTGGPRVTTAQPPGPIQVDGAVPVGHVNFKHINDAVYAAAEQLAGRSRERRKIIFLISDGQNAKNNTHSYDDTLKLCLASDISVYSIEVGERYVNHDLSVLAKYAHATGGDIFYASSREDLERLYARAFEQARNQYTLSYVPTHTDRSKPYHAIEVRVERAGLILLSRDGYYPNQTQ